MTGKTQKECLGIKLVILDELEAFLVDGGNERIQG